MKSRVAVLSSGGIDSCCMINDYIKKRWNVTAIYVPSEYRWEQTELIWLRRFLRTLEKNSPLPLAVLKIRTKDMHQSPWAHHGVNVPGTRSRDKAVYLPGRNLLLIAKAAVYCAEKKIPNLALAVLKSNPFPDASAAFLRLMEKAVSNGLNYKIRILTPYKTVRKTELIKRASSLPLHLTFSCMNPKRGMHCGRCNKCKERQMGFRKAGVYDITPYAVP